MRDTLARYMPLPINVHDLLHGEAIESERLELKAGWNPESVLHTLCAFANDFHNLGGGYIVLGVGERDGAPLLPPAGLPKDAIDRIPKILKAMKTNGSPAPAFEFDEDHSYFITRLRVHPAAARPVLLGEEAPGTPPVTPPVVRLLSLLEARGELGSLQMRAALGLKDRAHLRQAYVEPALASGWIEYTIPDKPNSRLQRYRITEAGRAWLAARQS